MASALPQAGTVNSYIPLSFMYIPESLKLSYFL